MYLHIPRLLKPSQVDEIALATSGLSFTDGRVSAGGDASEVKRNTILAPNEEFRRIADIVRAALLRNELVQSWALPKAVFEPEFARYSSGMQYGLHCDAALFNPSARNAFRTDISATVYLCHEHEYEGGLLSISHSGGRLELKASKGDAILYPSNYAHEVTEVTKGTRFVAVTWIQSYVRSYEARLALFDLSCLAADLQRDASAPAEARLKLTRAYNSLLRLWSEI